MMSKVEVRKKIGEDSGNAKLLREIETISKALYLDKSNSRPSISAPNNRSKPTGKSQLLDPKSKLKYGNEESSNKDKKSIWNWKPLKALSNVRSRKFNCCFSVQVHTIEGFPPSFENLSICVHWKRRDGELVTHPVKVCEGIAEIEEKLTHTCMVYGSRSGPHHSAKYEAKHFLLFVSVIGVRDLDLGKHRVDLTRLLPLTLEELEEEKSSGKWTTSYKLSGEAKGGILHVSFGYIVVGDSPIPLGNNQKVPEQFNLKSTTSRTLKPVPKFDQGDGKSSIHRIGSLPGALNQQRHASSRSLEDVKDLHEVLPTSRSELASLAIIPSLKYDEDKLNLSLDYKPELDVFTEHLDSIKSNICPVSNSSHENVENEREGGEFSVIEQGFEWSQEELEKPMEVAAKTADLSLLEDKINGCYEIGSEEDDKLHHQHVGDGSHKEDLIVPDCKFKEDEICTKDSVMQELEVALSNVTNLETEAFDSPEEENDMEVKTDYKTNREQTSLSLDDVTESVANDFLDMLGIEHSPFGLSSESEPESPRERLLRQFEKDALAGGYSLFDFGIGSEDQIDSDYNTSTVSQWGNFSEDFEFASATQAAEKEHQMETWAESGKTRAKMLEDLETEALMREWGLNDEAFYCSPPKSSGSFGSPIDLPPEELLELPPLGEGLGPCLQTTNGGFLRSMSPSLFKNAKNGGSLIMQVSSPVVVPAEMGSGITDILQQLASVGIEKLSMQANKLMPLEDITGKTMQQVAWEAADSMEGPERQILLQHDVEIRQHVSGGQKNQEERSTAPRFNKFKSQTVENEMGSEYVSLEDLAPLAMDKIEALSIEGLRIQSGISDEDAPSNISAQSIGEISAFQGKGINVNGSLDLEGAAGLQLLDIKDNGDDIDGLMGLSLTLDEWMRLDSGDVGDEDQISERTSRILAAHHASSLDVIHGSSKGERKRGKGSGRKCGLLGNNFTVALMVQLRDPLRNYEPVGPPMLALIQVERVFVPPKPKIYCKVSEVRFENDTDDESESVVKEKVGEKIEVKASEEGIPQFCITEVQVAGLKTESGKKLWGTTTQQQSGSRWLLANGMGKNSKQPFMKSKTAANKPATSLTTKVQRGDALWSISSRMRAK
ncbi:protein PLASTID MOVEMENT IMPAIRED 1-RELATED 1 [Ricinus communis]|nr:protein PLASTID MOVEMENT IMPAIRED 1-RELATED 1 [Ricinus communis]XP_048227598.1 protein PLASTID MOVEMENT IMPAIRED 1-RELATED 1 [Ricinus communis]|eukprot:XP_002514085.2 protein PLASTID MOVEMENT IMPAIRED 1-RELATED 1 [Ricinus communis]